MLEKTIEANVCKYAKKEGWLVFKFTSPSNRGVPDRMFIRYGVVFFIEFKATGKKPSKLQEKRFAQIRRDRVPVWVVDNVEDGRAAIDYHDGTVDVPEKY